MVNGYNIAKALFDSMGGEGQIFVVQGLLGNTASNARYEGLQKALEEYPNIEVVADDTANWNTDEALALVETWLTQYPGRGRHLVRQRQYGHWSSTGAGRGGPEG